jgi:hypothetical protein
MFALLFSAFSRFFSRRDETYLYSSTDVADLERRMRQIDDDAHAYSLSFCGSISRGNR